MINPLEIRKRRYFLPLFFRATGILVVTGIRRKRSFCFSKLSHFAKNVALLGCRTCTLAKVSWRKLWLKRQSESRIERRFVTRFDKGYFINCWNESQYVAWYERLKRYCNRHNMRGCNAPETIETETNKETNKEAEREAEAEGDCVSRAVTARNMDSEIETVSVTKTEAEAYSEQEKKQETRAKYLPRLHTFEKPFEDPKGVADDDDTILYSLNYSSAASQNTSVNSSKRLDSYRCNVDKFYTRFSIETLFE